MHTQTTVEERDIFDQMLMQLGENLDITPTGIDWDKINMELKPLMENQKNTPKRTKDHESQQAR
ncbi:MAG: hypothetical protein SGJ10_04640 [Bacteroidota bacterium]|nr:hypothetical protein [Bacteroidota bacterium]